MSPANAPLSEKTKGRLEAFSGGVLATVVALVDLLRIEDARRFTRRDPASEEV